MSLSENLEQTLLTKSISVEIFSFLMKQIDLKILGIRLLQLFD